MSAPAARSVTLRLLPGPAEAPPIGATAAADEPLDPDLARLIELMARADVERLWREREAALAEARRRGRRSG